MRTGLAKVLCVAAPAHERLRVELAEKRLGLHVVLELRVEQEPFDAEFQAAFVKMFHHKKSGAHSLEFRLYADHQGLEGVVLFERPQDAEDSQREEFAV